MNKNNNNKLTYITKRRLAAYLILMNKILYTEIIITHKIKIGTMTEKVLVTMVNGYDCYTSRNWCG